MKRYFYKLMVESGGAPCVYRDLLSLAICKPSIRASANVGDWIFGFGAKSTIGEKLIYVAEVTEKLPNGSYYQKSKYTKRPDCIYQWHKDRLAWKSGSKFHEGGQEKDIGGPPYDKAAVLLSQNFRYLGREGSEDYKNAYPIIAMAVAALKQGHRVNHSPELEMALRALQQDLWQRYPSRKRIGLPNDADLSRPCS
jgi:hypothetical protein